MLRSVILAATLAAAAVPAAADSPETPGDFENRPTRLAPASEPMHQFKVAPVRDHSLAEIHRSGRYAPDGTAFDPDRIVAGDGRWEAPRGASLKKVLEAWAESAGWQLAWESNYRYELGASAVFQGGFVEAASKLLTPFGDARPAVFAHFKGGNKVLLITTPGS